MENLKKFAASLLIGLSAQFALGQSVPKPAPAQTQPILLANATIHVGNGQVFTDQDLLIVNGKINKIGPALADESAKKFDLAGKHIYPGLIAPITALGLSEIEAVRSTNDFNEAGNINPNVRSIVSYNTDSRVTPTLRSNGILIAQIAPQGGLLSGQSSVVQLDAWNWEDAAYLSDDGLHLRWPSQRIWAAAWAPPREEQLKRIAERTEQIEQAFRDAKAYKAAKEAGKATKIDLRWEAMIPYLKGEKRVYFYADIEKDIRGALEFGQRQGLKMAIVGGADAWLLPNLLKSLDVPVIMQKPHSLPRTEDDPVDLPFREAIELHKAGVLVALCMDNFWNYRNLPFQAGQLVAMGLDKEAALGMISLNTAKILGIDRQTGSIEAGKDANIIVSEGDLLDMRSSIISLAFIQGRQIDLGNKQKDLFEKFEGR